MRIILWISLLLVQTIAFGQKNKLQVTDLLVYKDSFEKGKGYAEVIYSGNLEKLKSSLSKNFVLDSLPQNWVEINDSISQLQRLNMPRIGFHDYHLTMVKEKSLGNKHFLKFHVRSIDVESNYMNVQTGQARRLMELIQSSIDEALGTDFSHEFQNPNTMYIFNPEEINANLFGYLFFYSMQPKDSIMNKLCVWLVLYCDEVKTGYWVDANTYRIDNLSLSEFGVKDNFSLTIEHKKVEKGYTEYVIYLNNYHESRPSLNYSIRYHDLHKRLWHLYSYHLYLDGLQNGRVRTR